MLGRAFVIAEQSHPRESIKFRRVCCHMAQGMPVRRSASGLQGHGGQIARPVSYTHLTLPTICSV
eukprot:7090536-Alexandrium_andersonii.AAC.1